MPPEPAYRCNCVAGAEQQACKKKPADLRAFLGRVLFGLAAELGNQLTQTFFRVTKQHACVLFVEQGVLNARKTRSHRALQHEDRTCVSNIDDRHTVNR